MNGRFTAKAPRGKKVCTNRASRKGVSKPPRLKATRLLRKADKKSHKTTVKKKKQNQGDGSGKRTAASVKKQLGGKKTKSAAPKKKKAGKTRGKLAQKFKCGKGGRPKVKKREAPTHQSG